MLSFVVAVMSVFGFTLIVNKSHLFACKREFVEKRYESAQILWKESAPPWIIRWVHTWWKYMWHCPMCLGVWVSAIVVFFCPVSGVWILDWLAILGSNWFVHALEDVLVIVKEILEEQQSTTPG